MAQVSQEQREKIAELAWEYRAAKSQWEMLRIADEMERVSRPSVIQNGSQGGGQTSTKRASQITSRVGWIRARIPVLTSAVDTVLIPTKRRRRSSATRLIRKTPPNDR